MPGRTIRVLDQKALQQLLHEMAQEFGSQKDAATALGLSPATYSRLASGNWESVTLAVVVEIFRRLCAREGVVSPFGIAPKGLAALVFGRIPTDEEMQVQTEREGRGLSATSSVPEGVSYRYVELLLQAFVQPDMQIVESDWLRWLDGEYSALVPRYGSMVKDLWERDVTRTAIAHFLESIGWFGPDLPPATRRRTWVALCRAVRDLDAADYTQGAEPGWQDLRNDDRLTAVLKCRLAAEHILMRGESDDEEGNFFRVHEGVPPQTWDEYRAGMYGPPFE